VLGDLVAELARLLRGIDLVEPGRRQQLEVLHEAGEGDADDGQREDDPGAAPAADPEWDEAEVVAVGLHGLVLLQEALGAELVGAHPPLGVVGEEPGVDEDLGLGGDVVAGELAVVEVHVRDQQRDGHAQAQRLLDYGLEVGEALEVRLRHGHAGAAQDRGQLLPELGLDGRVVHQLRDAPLDRPQRRLDRCKKKKKNERFLQLFACSLYNTRSDSSRLSALFPRQCQLRLVNNVSITWRWRRRRLQFNYHLIHVE
jgi:hypothetical protein